MGIRISIKRTLINSNLASAHFIMPKNLNGYFFLAILILILIISPLFQHGIFGDGIMYLTVAFNRFHQYGDFWHQHYSKTAMNFFCEHPPLYFETANLFYLLLGGQAYAEKIFTLSLLALNTFFIVLIWNKLNVQSPKYKGLAWLPAALLLSIPVFNWSFSNQIIETLVAPLSLFAFYILLLFLEEQGMPKKIFLFLLFVFILLLLLLTKGLQSVFLLIAPLLLIFTVSKKRKNLLYINALVLLFFLTSACMLFWLNTGANEWLNCYVQKRLIGTFNHVGATTNSHTEILLRFLTELIPVFLFFILISVYIKSKLSYDFGLMVKNIRQQRESFWLILISLSASIPLSLTLEQRGFYLVPSFAFFVLGLSNMYKRYVFYFIGRLFRKKTRQLFMFLVFWIGINTKKFRLPFSGTLSKTNYRKI